MWRVLLAGACLFVFLGQAVAGDRFKIMIVTWRGCEQACQGFQDYLMDKGVDASFLLRDAEQDKARLPTFLTEARAASVDLLLTWGTSVTRGIAGTLEQRNNPAYNSDIPQVFMIVADPVGSLIVESLEHTGRDNLTGTFNRVPEAVNIETLRAYLPGFRRLGLLYHTDETNSLLKRDELAALAEPLGFELVSREMPVGPDGKPRVEDIEPQLAALEEAGAEVLYLGSSSFLRKAGDAVTEAAIRHGLPVLSPYEQLVRDSSALISVAPRYRDIGRLAGGQAERILVDRQRAGDLPVARMTDFAVVINMKTARKLRAFPPLSLLQVAETVN